MIKQIVLFSTLCGVVLAQQTPVVVPAGNIYQTAAGMGISYLEPSSASAILNEKSALNWKNIAVGALTNGTLFTALGGITGVIAIPTKLIEGLVIAHSVSDAEIVPLLQAGAPNPGNIAPVLQVTGNMSPTSTACAENSIFASAIQGSPSAAYIKNQKGSRIVTIGPVNIAGALVSFTPQGVQVLKNASGSKIKQFLIIDILACLPLTPIVPSSMQFVPAHTDNREFKINPDGVQGVAFHTGLARTAYDQSDYRTALHEYNLAIDQDINNANLLRESSRPLTQMNMWDMAKTTLDVADYIETQQKTREGVR